MCNSGSKRRKCAISTTFLIVAFAVGQTATAAPVSPEDTPAAVDAAPDQAPGGSAAAPDPDRLHVDIYPLFGWLPFYSSSFTVPPLPNGGGGSIGGGTNAHLSGAWELALSVTYKKFLIEGEGMFANVTATRDTPYADGSAHLNYGDVFLGWKVGKGFYPLVGVRRMALDFSATVLNAPTFQRKPGFWDPLIGIEYRKQLKHKFNVQGRFDIGGFGAGSTVDLDAQFRVEWRFVKHFGTILGYQVLYNKLEGTVNQQVLNTTINYPWDYAQTFHGPILGFGIYF
jgi:hypothetical protein